MKILRGIGFGINTVLFYLGLPLLGWGIGDVSGFLSLGPRRGYALLIVGLALAVWCQASRSPQGSRDQEDRLPGFPHTVALVVDLLLLGALLFLPHADRGGLRVFADSQAAGWAGVALFSLGWGVMYQSGVTLQGMYTPQVTLGEGEHWVRGGLYQRIRHPFYLGAVLLGFGLALTYRSWMGLLLTTAFLGLMVLRIRTEERLMQRQFGAEWEAYCQHTWRLIPFAY